LLLSHEYEYFIPLVDKLAKLSARDVDLVEALVAKMLA
jgi:hypothetical protein